MQKNAPWTTNLQSVWIGLLLTLLTLGVYLPILRCDFVNYDDPEYVTGNPLVKAGIHSDKLSEALFSHHAGNWHPLTWYSHMLDCQLYGLNPVGHHVTNVALHLLNTLLVFVLLRRLTGLLWQSAIVAALFAIHPTHVESVAWISERKDVLSTFFGLLSTWFYVSWAQLGDSSSRKKRYGNYLFALVLFAASLLSKAMLVTLPFVWLLLDVWPLGRFSTDEKKTQPSRIVGLLSEKLPFVVLSFAVSFVTYSVQTKAMMANADEKYSALFKSLLTVGAYWRYMLKLIWPSNLAVIYPLPREYHLWQHGVLALGLLVISAWGFFQWKRRGWFALGWFWFLGTLVPVIGIVKVGLHSIADRYTYFPSIGFFILLVWSGAWLMRRLSLPRVAAGLGVGLILCVLSIITVTQVGYWRNGRTLFEHATAVTKDNAVAHKDLGAALLAEGNVERSYAEFLEAIRLNPDDASSHNSLGTIFNRLNKIDEAVAEFKEAIRLDRDYASAYSNLSEILLKQGQFQQALDLSLKAIALKPDFGAAIYNAATAFSLLGKTNEAITHFEKALVFSPDFDEAHYNLAYTLYQAGRFSEAETHFLRAIQLNPKHENAAFNLGNLLLKQNRLKEAEGYFQKLLEMNPEMPEAHYQLGMIAVQQRQYGRAVSHWREAIRLKPGWTEPLNNLSWVLSTCPDSTIRDGKEALRLARTLETFTGGNDPQTLDTLAAAFAELGQFDEAVDHQTRAVTLAKERSAGGAKVFVAHLEQYREKKPFRE